MAGVGRDLALVVASGGSFRSLGGVLIGAPAVARIPRPQNSPLTIYIATGQDHDLWIRGDGDAGWRPLTSGGSVFCLDNPAATVIGSGSSLALVVACEGGDHAAWQASVAIGTTGLPTIPRSNWSSMGGLLSAGPAVAVLGGAPRLFVLGVDNHVWISSPFGWQSAAWTCIGHPAASFQDGITYFACNGSDRQLWYAANNGSWSAAAPLGGLVVDGPAVGSDSSGPVFYVEGVDAAVWHFTFANGWRRDGGAVISGVGAGG